MFLGANDCGLGKAPRFWPGGVRVAPGTQANRGPRVGFKNRSVQSARVAVRTLNSSPAFSKFSRVPFRGGSSWRPGTIHTFAGMGSDYAGDGYGPDDIGLGKFKLKKIVKAVAKPVAKAVKVVGKVAAAPTAVALQAVGAKSLAAKVGKAVDYTKGEMNVVKSAGKGAQIAAITAGAVVAAPYAGAALTAAGKGALVAGKFVATKGLVLGKALTKSGLVQKAVGMFAKNKAQEEATGETPSDSGAGPSPMDFSGVSDAVRQITSAGGTETSESSPIQNFSPVPGGPGVPSDEAGNPDAGAPEGSAPEAQKSPLSVLLPIGAALLLL